MTARERSLADPCISTDGRTLTAGIDDAGIWIRSESGSPSPEVVRLPAWRGGVGGMEWALSPDQRHAALFVYSGQSSQGFEVFALTPRLVRIGGLPEAFGHGDAPTFSPGGGWLVTWSDTDRRIHPSGEYFEDVQDDGAVDRVVVEWAVLHVMRMPEATILTVPVTAEIARSTSVDAVHEWKTYDALRFVSDEVLVLRMPWGEDANVRLPPEGPVACRLP
jgi:hypothetical protein